jgi:hypothetical protein
VYLLPLAAMLAVGSLGAAWQARHAKSEIAARARIIARSLRVRDWQRIPKWTEYRAQQDDPARFARQARRRAIGFAVAGACALATALLL